MHIASLALRNVKCLPRYDFAVSPEEAAGWHVFLGGNGAGKTTFIRSLALALAGPSDIGALNVGRRWRRQGAGHLEIGSIELEATRDAKWDAVSEFFRQDVDDAIRGVVIFQPEELSSSPFDLIQFQGLEGASATYWDPSCAGWFGACYGAYRRLTGGNPSYEAFVNEYERLAPYSTAFNESFALAEGLDWLLQIQRRALIGLRGKPDRVAEKTVAAVMRLLNEDVFPKEKQSDKAGVRLFPRLATVDAVTDTDVVFEVAGGAKVSAKHMSDGFRAVTSLVLDILRHMTVRWGAERVFDRILKRNELVIDAPGVVGIDEIDVHLHFSWQHRIGRWFKAVFPNVQFIVATHSPIICQEATSIWRMPREKEGAVEDKGEWRLPEEEYRNFVDGNILDALRSDLFGKRVSQSIGADLKDDWQASWNVMIQRARELEAVKKRVKRNSAGAKAKPSGSRKPRKPKTKRK